MLSDWESFLSNYPTSPLESSSLDSAPCISDLLSYGYISLTGKDAKTFLQGQLTCDVNEITREHSSLGSYCNIKGRMHCIFRIFQLRDSETYYLQMPVGVIDHCLQALKKYALFSKVTICQEDVLGFEISILANEQLTISDENVTTITLPSPPTHQRYLFLALPSQSEQLQNRWKTFCNAGFQRISFATMHCLDIREKIPNVYQQTIEQLLPHYVNLIELGGVSFKKGCYLGQEIVARMHYKGNIKKHLVAGYLSNALGALIPGEDLYHPSKTEPVGTMIDFALGKNGTNEILFIINDDMLDKIHELRLNNQPAAVIAKM